ncbi:MAG: protein translocase subunit SecD [Chloroflexota bacterium]
MIRNLYTRLVLIVVILAAALWVDLSDKIVIYNPINDSRLVDRDVTPRLGLDLRGGLQVLLEADVPQETEVDPESMQTARTIMENRTNALGVSENVLQIAGERRIVGEFPGLEDADAVLATIQQTGLLEFVDTGDVGMDPGMVIQTDFATGSESEAAPTPEGGAEAVIYHTVMTGKDLKQVLVTQDQLGDYIIQFELTSEGAKVFAEHTAANIQRYLTIVLDKQVISSPVIQSEIPDGQGIIQGNFTAESANALAVQLRYGSLPVPLKVVETRIIGPTLGEDSLQKSLRAGLVGMIVVMLFMAIYYRLPGLVADLSILFYAAIAFAIFKYFHFTLTLPGIAGFLLSTGAALDANILIFERLKEELRNGKSIVQAVDQGWQRARSSILDSNVATLITSGILFWFGSTFGATIVKGFSLTLALGVAISLFTAIFVTRTLLALVMRVFKPTNLPLWFGI